jgi:outer membrane receptor protein involved in Fe transport
LAIFSPIFIVLFATENNLFYMLKRILTLLVLAMLAGQFLNAQVTTSSITGIAKNSNGEPLVGATVTATHNPSGTVYTTIAGRDGVFTLPNLRIGGPYTIKVTFSGLQAFTVNDVNLELGQPFNVNAVLNQNNQTLETVVVSGNRRAAVQKTGASTNISNRQLTTLPTITRSITDFTRLTPQAGPSNSFGGRDGRLNNVTVDGANLNNNFGLSSDPLPGGGANPISLDAIEEISVNIAPYDVRQGNFTGANIAAVTKSGTNTFHGSAYGYYRNQKYIGRNVAGVKLPEPAKTYNKIYGATVGGPIIKNKLFFFLNAEYEEKPATLAYYIPAGGTGSGNQSAIPIDSLKVLSDYLKNTYKFDPGAYDNFQSDVTTKNHKYLGKIDWNITDAHKLTLKYSELIANSTSLPSQSGGINGASSLNPSIITYGPKFSPTAMAFGNTIYNITDKVRSGSFELKSNFHGKFANQLLATITKINTDKSHPGAQFPFADIAGFTAGSKNNYLSFGNEPFNGNYNVVVNDIYTATDNFNYFAGKHTLTAGVTYEFQKVGNGFMAGNQGYYAYGSLSDFLNNRAPKIFSITYSLVPGQDAVISANLKVGQLGGYVQDEINVNQNFKFTAGLRVDKPVYPEQPLANKAVNNLSLYDKSGNLTHYNTGAWPTSTLLWSPRVGFRWSVPDQNMVLRGGTGIFTGRIPFVWLTNMPTNIGPYQQGVLLTANTILDPTTGAKVDMNNFKFNPDAHAYNPFYNTSLPSNLFPKIGGTVVPNGAYAIIGNKFKFPQVWRTDFGIDKQLGKGWTGTIELLYSKDLNAVYMFNANQKTPDATVNLGGGVTRKSYSSAAALKLNSTSGNAVVLDNTSKGHQFNFTAQISKAFSKGFYGMVAYTYTFAQDVTANPGSQAGSVWSANPTSGTQNDIELSYSNFAVPHRVIASLSYRREYIKHLATTISAFYDGESQGQISYVYNGDVNGDGNATTDLMYIPRNPSEITFSPITASGNIPAFTAQQQSDAFFQFIAQDKYLSRHQGQVAERFGANQPWYNRVDMKLAQDIFANFGRNKYTLQFTVDVLNALNLINQNWGVKDFFIYNNPLTPTVSNGVVTYKLRTYLPRGATQQALLDRTYIKNYSTSSTYSLQLGLKLLF